MRITAAILFVVAASTAGAAQQLEQPPLMPPRREMPPRQFFPTPRLDSPLSPRPPLQPEVQGQATHQSGLAPRSGSVCLKSVPVDPSIDRRFVIPLPDVRRSLPMHVVEMPPCVTLAPQQTR